MMQKNFGAKAHSPGEEIDWERPDIVIAFEMLHRLRHGCDGWDAEAMGNKNRPVTLSQIADGVMLAIKIKALGPVGGPLPEAAEKTAAVQDAGANSEATP